MSSIIIRKIKKYKYCIEQISYRDKYGRPRTKQRCLGRIDDDGTLISSKRKLPGTIKEVKKITKKFLFEPINKEN